MIEQRDLHDQIAERLRRVEYSATPLEWCDSNSFKADSFHVDDVVERKLERGIAVSLVLPTRNVRSTIEQVLDEVSALNHHRAPLIDQVLVVDASSTDGTPELAQRYGVEVWNQEVFAPEFGPVLGKGDAMWRSLWRAHGDIIMFADADTIGFKAELVGAVLAPLLCRPDLRFVKAAYARPLTLGGHQQADGGGRVTELTARPLLNLLFPELSGFAQPLAGEFGCWRATLEAIPFVTGYGVESALLIDVLHQVGLPAMAQALVSERQNQHQSLPALSRMSLAVVRTILARAAKFSRLEVHPSVHLLGDSPTPIRYLQLNPSEQVLGREQHVQTLLERPCLDWARANRRLAIGEPNRGVA